MLFRWDQSFLTVHTPAKLNLFLEVLNKRPDGFHNLETVMVMLGIYDTLRFSLIPKSDSNSNEPTIQLRVCTSNLPGMTSIPTGSDNLVVQAAELLRSHAGYEGGAQIQLWKRIPAQAGLAGGSSDAAATLVGLNRLWKLNLPQTELHQLAAQLGSDVPFFLTKTPAAVCRGRGEMIEPLQLPLGLFFVVVKPKSGLSTPAVFRQWKPQMPRQSAMPLIDELHRGPSPRLAKTLFNALQTPAEALNSEIATLRDVFSKEPVSGHMMSGSGTAYFGLCRHRRHAEFVAARLSSRRIGRVAVARSQF
ncbi:MAG: 4-(cytidine 5'-diphospho)-2-C-methyl-D-erythritol kinase [Planctomycetaceae bacterium]|nr:4-(cytidine 5'-diphospho)-2-C-methyl-D-erythritol kinase [Planctomycetaceae bacterium]